jgi:hypothetical protein
MSIHDAEPSHSGPRVGFPADTQADATGALAVLLDQDAALTSEVNEAFSKRSEGRNVLVDLATKWVTAYGQMSPGRTQTVGTCTRCYLSLDSDAAVRVAKAGDWPHRPLPDQDCVVFAADCSYDGLGDRVWVPVAWLSRQISLRDSGRQDDHTLE